MDAQLQARAAQLAGELASSAQTASDVNDLLRLMMKSALEQMLSTELDVHLGRKAKPVVEQSPPASAAGLPRHVRTAAHSQASAAFGRLR